MPTSPPTPCTFPGCRALVRHGARCKKHKTEHVRPNAYRRGYGGKAWQRLRRIVLERDQGICQECGVVGARQVAHIEARKKGGPDHPDNLRLLCGTCHRRETVEEFGFGRQAPKNSEGAAFTRTTRMANFPPSRYSEKKFPRSEGGS